MKEILSPSEFKKKKSTVNKILSKNKINFQDFKKKRQKRIGRLGGITIGLILMPNIIGWSVQFIIGYIIAAIWIFGSPAIIQYARGDLNWSRWILYCFGMMFLGIGFIILLFFLPPEDRLEKEYREFKLKKLNNDKKTNI
jgi:tetrahydromethanopterin S-methyltransferase subunit G